MAFTVRAVEYFYATIRDQPGAAYRVLSALADRGVNLVAFTAFPIGPMSAQSSSTPGSTSMPRAASPTGRAASAT